MLLCRRIATSGVTCMKSGFGLVIDGTSFGSASIWSVIVPAGADVGAGVSSLLSSLLSSSEDALGCGVGVGLAVGCEVLFAPGEPLGPGDGVGMLNASEQLYPNPYCSTCG